MWELILLAVAVVGVLLYWRFTGTPTPRVYSPADGTPWESTVATGGIYGRLVLTDDDGAIHTVRVPEGVWIVTHRGQRVYGTHHKGRRVVLGHVMKETK